MRPYTPLTPWKYLIAFGLFSTLHRGHITLLRGDLKHECGFDATIKKWIS